MAQSTHFQQSNPFSGGRLAPGSIQRIAEEDDDVTTSPTEPSFRDVCVDPAHTTGTAASSIRSHPHPGGVGGSFGSFAFAAPGTETGGGAGPAGGNMGGNGHGNSGGSGGAEGGSSSGSPNDLPPSDTAEDDGTQIPRNYSLARRTSVSSESLNPTTAAEAWIPPYHPKTPGQTARLKTAVLGNFLFSHLDDEQSKTVLNALVEKPVPAKDIRVVVQGDAGDYFYIVEDGHFDVFIHPSGGVAPQSGPEALGAKVNDIGPGGSFGELALMYNAPRAASVVSTEPATLWQLDRVTFRRIIMDSAFHRRRTYEAFLEEVPLLSSLRPYERSKIADALDTIKFRGGDIIIAEGDPGESFYLLENGEAEAYKRGIDGPVKQYCRGGYFGELALLDDKPRQASVVACSEAKVARLGRDGFKRLLGPLEDIMRRTQYRSNAIPERERA